MIIFRLVVIFLFWVGLATTIIVFKRARRCQREAKYRFNYRFDRPWGGAQQAIKDFHAALRKANSEQRQELIKSQANYWKLHIRVVNHYVVFCVFLLVVLLMAGTMIPALYRL